MVRGRKYQDGTQRCLLLAGVVFPRTERKSHSFCLRPCFILVHFAQTGAFDRPVRRHHQEASSIPPPSLASFVNNHRSVPFLVSQLAALFLETFESNSIMAPISSQFGPDLRIELERAKDTGYCEFAGGDTICGHVIRESPLVDTDASIYIRLHGRSEFQFVASTGTTTFHYSSHFGLFDGPGKGLQIHRGPLHIPPDSSEYGRWPFAIPLPKHPDLAALSRDPSVESFSPLSDISSQGIPPSFRAKKDGLGPVIEGFVEYYLEVTMRCSGTRTTLIGAKKNKEFKAIKMVYVRSDVSPIPITDFDIKTHSESKQRVVSQRLIAGRESRLSVSQHIKKVIGSSQVPVYVFSLHLHAASVLQIGNPNYVPLRFRAETSWNDASQVLQSMPPTILVKNFVLKLQSMSLCSYKNTRSKKHPTERMVIESSLTLVDFSWTPDSNIASDADATTAKALSDAPPSADKLIVPQDCAAYLDLGVALGIRTPRKPGKEKIYPTFTTCNIMHTHSLEWWMTLDIGGETVKYHRRQPVTVIAPV